MLPPMRLYDAHNHLQDDRFADIRVEALNQAAREGLRTMVVNGAGEGDWPQVLELARAHPAVLPSFGLHPWYVKDRSEIWQETLARHLDQVPSAVGEIGLDRWLKDHDLPQQEEVFVWQLQMAARRNLPVTIHCLKAWGRLREILENLTLPACGFLLHSYGGPVEMVKVFADLGAYFSISGYFAHDRKARQRETFKEVPSDRLLIETDAPDLWPPDPWNCYPLVDPLSGKMMNHPANIGSVYRFVSQLLGEPMEALAARVERNFSRLFGAVGRPT